eukprot:3185840-Rhodomonas_salina.1
MERGKRASCNCKGRIREESGKEFLLMCVGSGGRQNEVLFAVCCGIREHETWKEIVVFDVDGTEARWMALNSTEAGRLGERQQRLCHQ